METKMETVSEAGGHGRGRAHGFPGSPGSWRREVHKKSTADMIEWRINVCERASV